MKKQIGTTEGNNLLLDVWLPLPESVNKVYRTSMVWRKDKTTGKAKKGIGIRKDKTERFNNFKEACDEFIPVDFQAPPRVPLKLEMKFYIAENKINKGNDLDNLLKTSLDEIFRRVESNDGWIRDLHPTKHKLKKGMPSFCHVRLETMEDENTISFEELPEGVLTNLFSVLY